MCVCVHFVCVFTCIPVPLWCLSVHSDITAPGKDIHNFIRMNLHFDFKNLIFFLCVTGLSLSGKTNKVWVLQVQGSHGCCHLVGLWCKFSGHPNSHLRSHMTLYLYLRKYIYYKLYNLVWIAKVIKNKPKFPLTNNNNVSRNISKGQPEIIGFIFQEFLDRGCDNLWNGNILIFFFIFI